MSPHRPLDLRAIEIGINGMCQDVHHVWIVSGLRIIKRFAKKKECNPHFLKWISCALCPVGSNPPATKSRNKSITCAPHFHGLNAWSDSALPLVILAFLVRQCCVSALILPSISGIGLLVTIVSFFQFSKLIGGNPSPFAICYTVGNILSLGATMFLVGKRLGPPVYDLH